MASLFLIHLGHEQKLAVIKDTLKLQHLPKIEEGQAP